MIPARKQVMNQAADERGDLDAAAFKLKSMQKDLFENYPLFANYVTSISFSNEEILHNILKLYVPAKRFEIDPCYNKGSFYKGRIPKPLRAYDINPLTHNTIEADARNLPERSNSVSSIIFDPPFIISYDLKETAERMQKRYSSFMTFAELEELYRSCLVEFYRILKRKGILVFKCQDVLNGGKQYFSHCHVFNWAIEHGFAVKDLFVLLSKKRIKPPGVQRHARKYHCYFWVFEKR